MSVEHDLETYCKAMGQPNGWETCLRIERKYALDGYPPPVVTEWMSAEIKEEGSGDAAIDRMLANDPEDSDAAERDALPESGKKCAFGDPICPCQTVIRVITSICLAALQCHPLGGTNSWIERSCATSLPAATSRKTACPTISLSRCARTSRTT